MTRSRLRRKSTSELPGQSCRALPNLSASSWASNRHSTHIGLARVDRRTYTTAPMDTVILGDRRDIPQADVPCFAKIANLVPVECVRLGMTCVRILFAALSASTHRLCRGHHVRERRLHFLPAARLETAIGIHPDLIRRETLPRLLEQRGHVLRTGTTR